MSRVSSTAPDTVPWSMSGMQRMSTVTSAPPFDLLGDRRADGERRPHQRSRRGPARRSAAPRRWRAPRCGAAPTRRWATCTPPAAARIEEDHPVADARRLLGLDVLGVEREVAGRDHAGEPVEDGDVGALELTGLAAERRRRLPGEHPDHLAVAAHRDAEHPHPLLQGRDGGLALDDLAEPEGTGDERPLLLVDGGADPVGPVDGLRGARPDLPEHEEAVAVLRVDGGREQQEVGEAEVGQEPPPGDQALEVADSSPVEGRVEASELGERGHGPLRLRGEVERDGGWRLGGDGLELSLADLVPVTALACSAGT